MELLFIGPRLAKKGNFNKSILSQSNRLSPIYTNRDDGNTTLREGDKRNNIDIFGVITHS